MKLAPATWSLLDMGAEHGGEVSLALEPDAQCDLRKRKA